MFRIIFCCSIVLATLVILILLLKFLQYIRKLLFSDLDKDSITNVLKQLRKLPWSECEQYILKCFMKVHKGKYGQIHLIASLTSGLSRHHDEFAVAVVDEVCSFHCILWTNTYGFLFCVVRISKSCKFLKIRKRLL